MTTALSTLAGRHHNSKVNADENASIELDIWRLMLR